MRSQRNQALRVWGRVNRAAGNVSIKSCYLRLKKHTKNHEIIFEKLTGFQLVNNFPAFYETQTFIAAFIKSRQLYVF
jgi:hypothetical protein